MDPHGILVLQKANYIRYAVFRGYTQTHVNVVRHQMPYQHIYSLLPTQLLGGLSYSPSGFAIQSLLAIFGHKYHMVFAFPANMRLTLPIMHRFFLLVPDGTFPKEEPISLYFSPGR